jgi:hypothetical protein
MLGCFVGAPDTAARGVPDRFLGKPVEKTETKPVEVQSAKDSAKTVPNGTATAEAMEVDQTS